MGEVLKPKITSDKINKLLESKMAIILSIVIGIGIGFIASKDRYIIPKEFSNIEQIEEELKIETNYQSDNYKKYSDFLKSPEGEEYKKNKGGFDNE